MSGTAKSPQPTAAGQTSVATPTTPVVNVQSDREAAGSYTLNDYLLAIVLYAIAGVHFIVNLITSIIISIYEFGLKVYRVAKFCYNKPEHAKVFGQQFEMMAKSPAPATSPQPTAPKTSRPTPAPTSKTTTGKSPAAKAPVGKSPATKPPVGKSPALKAPDAKSPASTTSSKVKKA